MANSTLLGDESNSRLELRSLDPQSRHHSVLDRRESADSSTPESQDQVGHRPEAPHRSAALLQAKRPVSRVSTSHGERVALTAFVTYTMLTGG